MCVCVYPAETGGGVVRGEKGGVGKGSTGRGEVIRRTLRKGRESSDTSATKGTGGGIKGGGDYRR